MSNSNIRKSTVATTIKGKAGECIKTFKVTNQFKRMMSRALQAQLIVLRKREAEFSGTALSKKAQKDFYDVFGVKPDLIITIDSKEEKEKQTMKDDEINKDSGNEISRDPYIEKRENVTAFQFMKEGIGRLVRMCEKLHVDDPTDSDQSTHGNFINRTQIGNASANVSSNQTIALSEERYSEVLKINIMQNFVCKPLTGPNSQVSTLCHELSHFYRCGEFGELGGMGTDDMPTEGGYSKDKKYIDYANNLRKGGSQYVFRNAYNIEKYFEIELTAEEVNSIES